MDPQRPVVLITFRTYGSWLHGDARGSVDRHRNSPTQTRLPPKPAWESYERSRMTMPEVLFTEEQRAVATRAIENLACVRGWHLYATNVRTNHAHVVAGVTGDVRQAVVAMKSAATVALRAAGLMAADAKVWSRGCSVRRLADVVAVRTACRYVIEGQGEGLGVVGKEV